MGNVDLIPHCSIWALTKGWRLFLKESIEVGLFWSSVSIKLDGLRMLEVRRPITNFLWYWESYLMQLQLVYMEVFESPKLFQEKPWTQPKARDLWLPGSDAYAGANKSWFYHKGTKLQTGCGWSPWHRLYIPKWFLHFSLACESGTTGLSLEE